MRGGRAELSRMGSNHGNQGYVYEETARIASELSSMNQASCVGVRPACPSRPGSSLHVRKSRWQANAGAA